MRQLNVPTGTLFSLGDMCESSNYLEAIDSSATNSTCSFDNPPDVLPPVPPRLANPPRHNRISANDHLIIIDTDDTDSAPVPLARTKPKLQTAKPRMSFENNFVLKTNALNRCNPIEPAPQPHKLNESKMSEVRRIPSIFTIQNHRCWWLFGFIIFSDFCVSVCWSNPNEFLIFNWWWA